MTDDDIRVLLAAGFDDAAQHARVAPQIDAVARHLDRLRAEAAPFEVGGIGFGVFRKAKSVRAHPDPAQFREQQLVVESNASGRLRQGEKTDLSHG